MAFPSVAHQNPPTSGFNQFGYFDAEYWDGDADQQYSDQQQQNGAVDTALHQPADVPSNSSHQQRSTLRPAIVEQLTSNTPQQHYPLPLSTNSIVLYTIDLIMTKLAKRSNLQTPSTLSAWHSIFLNGISQTPFSQVMSLIDSLDTDGGTVNLDQVSSSSTGNPPPHAAHSFPEGECDILIHPPSETGHRKAMDRNAAASALVHHQLHQQPHLDQHQINHHHPDVSEAEQPTSSGSLTPPSSSFEVGGVANGNSQPATRTSPVPSIPKTPFIDTKTSMTACLKISTSIGIPDITPRKMLSWCVTNWSLLTRIRDISSMKSGRSSFDRNLANVIRSCGIIQSISVIFSIQESRIQCLTGPFTPNAIVEKLQSMILAVLADGGLRQSSKQHNHNKATSSNDLPKIGECVLMSKEFLTSILGHICKIYGIVVSDKPLDWSHVNEIDTIDLFHGMNVLEQARQIAYGAPQATSSGEIRSLTNPIDIHPLAPYLIATNITRGAAFFPFDAEAQDGVVNTLGNLDRLFRVDYSQQFQLVLLDETHVEVIDINGYHIKDASGNDLVTVPLEKKTFILNTESLARYAFGMPEMPVQKAQSSRQFRTHAQSQEMVHVADHHIHDVDIAPTNMAFEPHDEHQPYQHHEHNVHPSVEEQNSNGNIVVVVEHDMNDGRVHNVTACPQAARVFDDIGASLSSPVDDLPYSDSSATIAMDDPNPQVAANNSVRTVETHRVEVEHQSSSSQTSESVLVPIQAQSPIAPVVTSILPTTKAAPSPSPNPKSSSSPAIPKKASVSRSKKTASLDPAEKPKRGRPRIHPLPVRKVPKIPKPVVAPTSSVNTVVAPTSFVNSAPAPQNSLTTTITDDNYDVVPPDEVSVAQITSTPTPSVIDDDHTYDLVQPSSPAQDDDEIFVPIQISNLFACSQPPSVVPKVSKLLSSSTLPQSTPNLVPVVKPIKPRPTKPL